MRRLFGDAGIRGLNLEDTRLQITAKLHLLPAIVARAIACPQRIRTVLTENRRAFTDRLFWLRKRAITRKHEFDQLSADPGIEHRSSPPMHPQTIGMVERFNGRIEEVLQSHHFHSGEELETTLHRYVRPCYRQLPRSALGSKTPLQVMKGWHKLEPGLFRKQP